MPRTITVMIKDDFDPTLGADVIEAVEDFEQLLSAEFETLEILNDPDTMDALADAERDVANGDLVEMEG